MIYFLANGVRCAVPLSGGSGRLGVVELPCGATRLSAVPCGQSALTPAAGGPPALLHAAPLQDWAFDPFNDRRLLVACDDGMVREWILPEGGLVALVSILDLNYFGPYLRAFRTEE